MPRPVTFDQEVLGEPAILGADPATNVLYYVQFTETRESKDRAAEPIADCSRLARPVLYCLNRLRYHHRCGCELLRRRSRALPTLWVPNCCQRGRWWSMESTGFDSNRRCGRDKVRKDFVSVRRSQAVDVTGYFMNCNGIAGEMFGQCAEKTFPNRDNSIRLHDRRQVRNLLWHASAGTIVALMPGQTLRVSL